MPLIKARKSYQRLDDDQEDGDATKKFKILNSGISSKFVKKNLKIILPRTSNKATCDLKIKQELQKNVEGNTTHQLFDQVQEEEEKDLEVGSYVSLISCDDVDVVNNIDATDIESSDNLTENIYASIGEDIYSITNDFTGSSEDYMHGDEYTVVSDRTQESHMSLLNTRKSVYQRISEDDENSSDEENEKVGRIVSSESRIDRQRFSTRCRSMFDLITDNHFYKNFNESERQIDHDPFNKRGHSQSTLKCSNLSFNEVNMVIDKDTNDEPSEIKYTDEGIYSTISDSIDISDDDHYETVDDLVSSTWVFETIALLDNVMKGDHKKEENIEKESKISIKPRREDPSLKRYTLDSTSNLLSTSCFDLRPPTMTNNIYAKVSKKCHESFPYNSENCIPSNLCRTASILEINFESPIVNLMNSSYTNTEERAPPLPLKEKIRYDVKLSDEKSDLLLGYRQNSAGTFNEDQNKQPVESTLYQTPIRADVHKAQGSHEILRDLRHGLMKSERPLRESAIFYTKAQPYPGNHSPGADTKKL